VFNAEPARSVCTGVATVQFRLAQVGTCVQTGQGVVFRPEQVTIEVMPRQLFNIQMDGALVPEASRLRLLTIVRLRWFAVFGQLVAVAVVNLGYGFPLPVGYCLLLIAISAWLNVFLRLKYVPRHRLSNWFATSLLAYDLLQLAALLFLTGGIENPFIVLIVAPVTVSAASLPGRNTLLLGAIAVLATVALAFFHLPLPWSGSSPPVFPSIYRFGLLVAMLACTIFLAIYAWRLSHEARQMSAALTATELVLAREQQLHALDGLAAAAAHELGTPLGTIVLVSKEMAQQVPADSTLRDDLDLMRTQAERCRDILQKLTRQPSGQDPMHASMTLEQVIDEAAEPYRAAGKSILVNCGPSDPDAAGRAPEAQRLPGLIYGLGNLIENAVDFAAERVEISASWSDDDVQVGGGHGVRQPTFAGQRSHHSDHVAPGRVRSGAGGARCGTQRVRLGGQLIS
jgi:two-component system sensor histidine kinase RegB